MRLVVGFVVSRRDLDVGDGAHVVLKGFVASRVGQQICVAVLMQLFELMKLLLRGLREHVDHRLDLLRDLSRLVEATRVRLHPLNQHLLQLLGCALLVGCRRRGVFVGETLRSERCSPSSCVGVRRLRLLAAMVLGVHVEV